MEYIFYDTCALLSDQKEIFKKDEKFYLSSITLNELENIKTSGTKDEETKYNARILLHALAENKNKYEIVLFQENFLKEIKKFNLPDTNDTKIISCALHLFKKFKNETCIFYTKDLACEALAAAVGLNVIYKKDVIDKYSGYAEFTLNDETLAQFYEKYLPNNDISFFEPKLFENEYLLIKNCANEIIDKYKWHHNELVKIPFYKAESKMFGKIVPKDGDPYQQIALDSLYTNQITMLRGAAGSGKAQPNSTLIPTKNGYIKLGDIKVGDFILDRFGNETQVLAVYPQGLKENYKISFSDGRIAYCNNEHLWSCYTSKGNLKQFTVQEMIDNGLQTKSGEWKYKIPISAPVEYEEKHFDIDPYVIGAFLGDG